MHHRTFLSVLAVSLLATASLPAQVLNIDVSGITTTNGFGDPGNTVLTFNIGANVSVTHIGWNVNLTALSPSWLSEIQVIFGSTTTPSQIFASPGFSMDAPGTATFTQAPVDLSTIPLTLTTGADGLLRLEFVESFTDVGTNPNGIFNPGSSLTVLYNVSAVPEPGTYAAGAGALALLGGMLFRRRRTATATA